ncbi:hypothetical protein HMPREF9371_0092 [Neisseria shayeganii 871]|uniref:Uncharacterized protein n=1 Tax=Neisseria shayeganii 871 TaxID=1032488 RepID=G4CEQ3_9NEIS|nr:hypothetical protein HMPREF9371_0092 [Neisseria shayeganii 871]
MQNPHLRRIFALCAARSLAYLDDMSVPRGFLAFTFAALLRLELLDIWGFCKGLRLPETLSEGWKCFR